LSTLLTDLIIKEAAHDNDPSKLRESGPEASAYGHVHALRGQAKLDVGRDGAIQPSLIFARRRGHEGDGHSWNWPSVRIDDRNIERAGREAERDIELERCRLGSNAKRVVRNIVETKAGGPRRRKRPL